MHPIFSNRLGRIVSVVAFFVISLFSITYIVRAFENSTQTDRNTPQPTFIGAEKNKRKPEVISRHLEPKTQTSGSRTQSNGKVQPRITITWSNPAGGSFTIPSNWNPPTIPGVNDIAVIDLPGTYTVTLNSTQALGGLVLGGATGTQTLSMTGGSLALSGTSTINSRGIFALGGGTLTGTGTLTLNGNLNWTAGTIGGSLTVNIANGGAMTLSGTLGKSFSNSIIINNSGTFTFGGTNTLGVATGNPVFNNLAGGVFDIQNNQILGGPCTLNNAGTFRKSAGTTSTSCNWVINNTGIFDIQTGDVVPVAGMTLNAGSMLTRFTLQTGTVTVAGDSSAQNLIFSGGTINGTGKLTITGTMNWDAGTLGGTLNLTIASTGTVTVGSSFGKSFGNSIAINNSGTFIFGGTSGITVSAGNPVFNNLAGGVFHIQNNQTLGGPCTFNNSGTLRKSVVTSTTSCNWVIVNNGMLDIQSGQVDPIAGITLNTGSTVVSFPWSNGRVTVGGTVTANSMTNSGGILDGTGTLNVMGGRLSWLSGSIGGTPTINITDTGELNLSGAGAKAFTGSPVFNNFGLTVWKSGSSNITVSSGSPTFNNRDSGIFDIQNNATLGGAGTFNNFGILRKTAGVLNTAFNWPLTNSGIFDCPTSFTVPNFTQTALGLLNLEIGGLVAAVSYDRLQVTSRATLAGTVNLILKSRFNPVNGQNFDVLTFSEVVGTFGLINGQNANNGLRFQVNYNLGRVTVTALTGGGSPTITNITPTLGTIGGNVTITGTNFTGATGVFFNGRRATSFTVDSPSQITVVVPSNMVAGRLQVVTPGGTAISSQNFAISGDPLVVNAVGPTSGGAGQQVTAFLGTPGRRLVEPKQFTGTTSVQFNGTEATDVNVTPGQIDTSVPSGGETGPVLVSTQTGSVQGLDEFTVTNDPDLVTGISLTEARSAAGSPASFDVIFTVPTPESAPGIVTLDIPLDATLVDLNGPFTVSAGALIPPIYLAGDLTVQRLNGLNGIRVQLLSSIDPVGARIDTGTGVLCHVSVPLLPTAPAQGAVLTVSSQSPFNTNLLRGAAPNNVPLPYTVTANQLTVGPVPTVTQFYPVAATSGKILTLVGTNFIAGTQVFFGDNRLIPAANVTFVNSTTLQVTVPASFAGAGNVNGYLTILRPDGGQTTTEGLPANAPNPGNPTAVSPEFVLWADVTGDGQFTASDITLARAFLLFQATPTARQSLAVDVVPLNGNGSRGNGQLSASDFTFLRAVSFGQATF